jgi:hypothetical protein
MAIDAVIRTITEDGDDLILELEPRVNSDGHSTLAGRDTLKIKDFKFKPEVGQEIWGGSSTVHIEPTGRAMLTKHYRRIGYGELKEDFDYALRSKSSSRFA